MVVYEYVVYVYVTNCRFEIVIRYIETKQNIMDLKYQEIIDLSVISYTASITFERRKSIMENLCRCKRRYNRMPPGVMPSQSIFYGKLL